MRVKELFTDDDAVSPVIGVILMVAITVILAAVIAAFVLGLGSSADEVQPNTSFDVDWDTNVNADNDDILSITISSGDNIDPDVTYIRGDLASDLQGVDETWTDMDDTDEGLDTSSAEFIGSPDDTLSSGQGIEFTIDDSDGDVREHDFSIVWDTGDDSATIGSFDGPNA